MAYDPVWNKAILFGGSTVANSTQPVQDTWGISFGPPQPSVTFTSNCVLSSPIVLPVKAPSNLHVTLEDEFSISIQWNDRSDNEDTFVIERRGNGSGWVRAGEVGKNVTTFKDDNPPLFPSSTYEYRVKAINSETESTYSNVVIGFTCSDPFFACLE